VEEPSQAVGAIALRNGNIDCGCHMDLLKREESVYSGVVLDHIPPHKGLVHALLRSLNFCQERF
jgi:hypothetical protein